MTLAQHPTGVVVGASADMVLQPYGAFLAGAAQSLHAFNQQEVPPGCFPPSDTRQLAGKSLTA